MKHTLAAVATIVIAVAPLAACSGSKTAPEATVTATPIASNAPSSAPAATTLDVTITATTVTPTGATATVGVNQLFTFKITATAAGELHVHSTPEQHLEYPAGTSEVTVTFKIPGTVVVEDHALDRQIVQIQVR